MPDFNPHKCPLCSTNGATALSAASPARDYHACPVCRLVFVPPQNHLTPDQERARYLLHRNSPDDAGYVSFLEQIIKPALPLIPPGAAVLDYGCGPVPVLAKLLASHGFVADSYDPCFFPSPPRSAAAAIFATEVIEHFRQPHSDFAQLLALLAPGGLLCLMTELYRNDTDFAHWPYTSDPTHIAFYHEETMSWLGAKNRLTPIFTDHARVILLRRPA